MGLAALFSRLFHPRLSVGSAPVAIAALTDGSTGGIPSRNQERPRFHSFLFLNTRAARLAKAIMSFSANLALRRFHALLCNRYITASILALLALPASAQTSKNIHQFNTFSGSIDGTQEMLLWAPATNSGATYKTTPNAIRLWQLGITNNFTGALQQNGNQVSWKSGVWVAGNCLQAGDTLGAITTAPNPCGTGSGGGGSTPGGSNLSTQYNNAGALGGYIPNGDATVDVTTGVFTVSKTNGVAFAPSATTNALNAANINAGTLPAARLPTPTTTTLGGVQALPPIANQYLTGISAAGAVTQAPIAFSNIAAGTITPAQCPLPSASTIGCAQSFAGVTSQWLRQLSTSGVFTASQPSFSDLLGNIGVGQMNSGAGASSSTFWRGDSQWATPAGGGNVSGPSSSTTGDFACYANASGTVLSDCGPQGLQISLKSAGYTMAAGDAYTKVVLTSGSFAFTFPVAGSIGFEDGKWFCTGNSGTGLLTITLTTSSMTGAPSLILPQNTGLCLTSKAGAWDGTSSQLGMGPEFTLTNGTYTLTGGIANSKLANMNANTVKANFTAGSAAPSDYAMPSCSDTSGNHLNYVSGTGITCGTSSIGATGTSGHTIPFLDGNNSYSGVSYFTGSIRAVSRTTTSSPITVSATTDYIICVNTSSGSTTANLPASPATDLQYVIKDCKGNANVNNITVKTTDGTAIDGTAGATGIVLNAAYQSTDVFFNGTQWFTF